MQCLHCFEIATSLTVYCSGSITTFFSVVDSCTCFEAGNYYRPVSSTGCTNFTQSVGSWVAGMHMCPAGLTFNIHTCVCDYPSSTNTCPSNCPNGVPATTPPTITGNFPPLFCQRCMRGEWINAYIVNFSAILRLQWHHLRPCAQYQLCWLHNGTWRI